MKLGIKTFVVQHLPHIYIYICICICICLYTAHISNSITLYIYIYMRILLFLFSMPRTHLTFHFMVKTFQNMGHLGSRSWRCWIHILIFGGLQVATPRLESFRGSQVPWFTFSMQAIRAIVRWEKKQRRLIRWKHQTKPDVGEFVFGHLS